MRQSAGLLTAGCVLLVLLVSLPAGFYPTDGAIVRAEAAQWVASGSLGIPLPAPTALQPYRQVRGMYFFERDDRGVLHSKYGIAYTLLSLPPLWAERLQAHAVTVPHETASYLLWLGVWNALLVFPGVLYLYGLAGWFSRRPVTRGLAVLAALFCTFHWYYLRASALEVYQFWPAMGFAWHAARLVAGDAADGRTAVRRDSLAAAAYASALVLMRPSHILLYAVLLGLLAYGGPPADARRGVRGWLLAVAGTTLLVLGAVNSWKFGHPLATGYGQWRAADGDPADRFSPVYLAYSLPGFFLRLGEPNVWLHHPVALLGVLALRGLRAGARRAGYFLGALFLLDVLLYGSFSHWSGGYVYGPRYLANGLALLSAPAAAVFDRMGRGAPGRRGRRIAWTLGVVGVLALSLRAQWQVNGVHFKAYDIVRESVQRVDRETSDAYFDRLVHRAQFSRDLQRFRDTGRFPPLDQLREAGAGTRLRTLEMRLAECAEPNYLAARLY